MATNGTTNGHAANGSSYTVPLLIDGKDVVTETTFDVISPSSHKLLWHASSASKKDALGAVAAAAKALPSWAKTKPTQRRDILLRAADILEKRGEECGDYMMQETGALQQFAGGFNVPVAVEQIRDCAGRITSVMGAIPTCAQEGTSALIVKEPYGVILGIAPWLVSIYPLARGGHSLTLSP